MSGHHRKELAVWKLRAAAVAVVVGAASVGFWTVNGHPTPEQEASAATVAAAVAVPYADADVAPKNKPPVAALFAAGIDPAPAQAAVLELAKLPCSTDLSATQPHVAMVGNFLKGIFHITNVGGAVGRAGGADDHATGLALDFMVMNNTSLGDALAQMVLANKERFGVTYVIWQQRYNDGNGWSMMEDRGSPTANHYDHVHVSFAPSSDTSLTC